MPIVRLLRGARNAPHVTRHPVFAASSFHHITRSNSTTSVLQPEENGPEKNDTKEEAPGAVLNSKKLRSTKRRTPELDKVFGQAHTKKAKEIGMDLRRLDFELRLIHGHARVLRQTIKGPYSVRNSSGGKGQVANMTYDGKVAVSGGKVWLAGHHIPNIWLRDNCQCSSCVHDTTKQRLLDTFSIPKDVTIESRSFDKDVLTIEWSDGHKSTYDKPFLGRIVKTHEHRAVARRGLIPLELWGSEITGKAPIVTESSPDASTISKVLHEVRKYGFCYVDKTPFDTPAATEALLRQISFIRETHYGGFYDFTADLASQDTAYTNIALEAHTDTTYFSEPAGLQAFHLLSHTDGEGGASLLVDGFKVADELLNTDRKAYEILSTINVHAHASGNDGISIQPYRGFPVLEHDTTTGDLLRVRWNSSDRASIELPIAEVETWYDAARKFDALLKKKENEYWEQLTPGRVLIFDNWRVLHGRSKFTGKRRICGGYINRDDWISKFKMVEFGKDTVLGNLASS